MNLKYTNIILTVLLAATVILGGAVIAMFARTSKESEKNSKMLQEMSYDVDNIADEVDRISDTVYDIMEQGCTGSSNPDDPDDPYDPFYLYPDEVDKPVIYLYGDKGGTEAHVELVLHDAKMLTVWPLAYQNADTYSWDVFAGEDGTIYDKKGIEYSYLFWEAQDYGNYTFDKGFCVAGSDTADFLWTELKEIGLSDKEANEFIVYWLPRMQDNAYNLISFEGLDPSDSYNKDFELKVTDGDGNTADSVLRVMMAWKAVNEPVEIEPQTFNGFERNGFTVVEWGGSEVSR